MVDVDEAARRLGLGRTKLYDLIGSGALRTVTVGRRRLVPVAALDELVADLLAGESAR
ncbi:MAG: transcriptional regulator [Acidobacteria bacterium]|nr:MAG: transcriptional regulator [Acidobacteriota bacterium]